jgi:hypothetical protein
MAAAEANDRAEMECRGEGLARAAPLRDGLLCSGQLDLATAQQAIATDWIKAYEKFIGKQ